LNRIFINLVIFCFYRKKLDFYANKCNNLEKDLANAQENHGRETEDWKKFQADLQTAVRVANDFMTGKFIQTTFKKGKFV
jgi:hypothetical protein